MTTLGGAVNCIENGSIQRELANEAYKKQLSIEKEEKIVVGVNRFIEEEEQEIQIFKQDSSSEEKQVSRLKKLKSNRNTIKLEESLRRVEEDAKKGVNMIPSIVEAVKNYATLGEIVDVLKNEYGLHEKTDSF